MTGVASLRESGGDVVGNVATQSLGAIPICRVAGVAGGAVPIRSMAIGIPAVAGRQAVVVAHMALIAVCGRTRRGHLVIAGQRPIRGVVAPGSGGEGGGGGVAVGAVGRGEGCTRRGVHRIVGAVVIGLVTVLIAAAGGSLQIVTAGGGAVTLRALHRGVQAGQRESGVVVVES